MPKVSHSFNFFFFYILVANVLTATLWRRVISHSIPTEINELWVDKHIWKYFIWVLFVNWGEPSGVWPFTQLIRPISTWPDWVTTEYWNKQELLCLGSVATVPKRLYTVSTLQALSGSAWSAVDILVLQSICLCWNKSVQFIPRSIYTAMCIVMNEAVCKNSIRLSVTFTIYKRL